MHKYAFKLRMWKKMLKRLSSQKSNQNIQKTAK